MSLFFFLPTPTRPYAQLPADDSGLDDINATATCYSGVSINTDGNVYWIGTTGPGSINKTDEDKGTYIVAGNTSDFWFRCTVNSGTLHGSSSATGSWIKADATTRDWYIQDTTENDGAETANITIEVATDSNGDDITDSETYTLSANWFSL